MQNLSTDVQQLTSTTPTYYKYCSNIFFSFKLQVLEYRYFVLLLFFSSYFLFPLPLSIWHLPVSEPFYCKYSLHVLTLTSTVQSLLLVQVPIPLLQFTSTIFYYSTFHYFLLLPYNSNNQHQSLSSLSLQATVQTTVQVPHTTCTIYSILRLKRYDRPTLLPSTSTIFSFCLVQTVPSPDIHIQYRSELYQRALSYINYRFYLHFYRAFYTGFIHTI